AYSCNGADRCVQGACVQGGAACVSFSDCCSGVCAKQVCNACAVGGETCNSSVGCCVGLLCYQGRCLSCEPDGTSCADASQCCSGICSLGSCQACSEVGASCNVQADCCSGTVCASGKCTPACNIGGQSVPQGQGNSSNPCQVCDPSTSATS